MLKAMEVQTRAVVCLILAPSHSCSMWARGVCVCVSKIQAKGVCRFLEKEKAKERDEDNSLSWLVAF